MSKCAQVEMQSRYQVSYTYISVKNSNAISHHNYDEILGITHLVFDCSSILHSVTGMAPEIKNGYVLWYKSKQEHS